MKLENQTLGAVIVAALAGGALVSSSAIAASSGPAAAPTSKIVCWKDNAGKIIGCGDKVPPEYLGSATKEMDAHGVTRKQTESADEANQRRLREQEAARIRAEEERKSLGQKRQDAALLETYSNEKEIDLKRDRDLQVLDLQIEQLTAALKSTNQRYSETRGRVDAMEKGKKPVPPLVKEELTRLTTEKQRFEQSIQTKNKEKDELRARYAEYRKRFAELRAQQVTASSKK